MEHQINEEIRDKEVRLIGAGGEQLGIMSAAQAQHIADEQGRLPVWHLWGNETDCMVGTPGIVAVADAIVKGIGGFDREKAFEALRKTAMNPGRGNGLRMEYGYIPCEMFNEAVAYDMEYALADGAAARAAETLARRRMRSISRSAAIATATISTRRRDLCGAGIRKKAGGRPSMRSPRRTAPTTTARATPGSIRGWLRMMSQVLSDASAAGRGCSKNWTRCSR